MNDYFVYVSNHSVIFQVLLILMTAGHVAKYVNNISHIFSLFVTTVSLSVQVKFVRRCATAHLQHVNSSEKVVTTDEKVVTINNSRSPVEPVKWIYGYGAP